MPTKTKSTKPSAVTGKTKQRSASAKPKLTKKQLAEQEAARKAKKAEQAKVRRERNKAAYIAIEKNEKDNPNGQSIAWLDDGTPLFYSRKKDHDGYTNYERAAVQAAAQDVASNISNKPFFMVIEGDTHAEVEAQLAKPSILTRILNFLKGL
jgi:hypothetical protein